MYSAKIVADSTSPHDIRLTTLEVVFPRFILAEFNTHRMLSRNSASSRAIPTEKIIEQVERNPFVPEFNARVKGMGVGDPLGEDQQYEAEQLWLKQCVHALDTAETMKHIDKSRVNRLLEPFMWHTCIVTATEWSNFYALRTHEDAQPEFRKLALMMQEAMEKSSPQPLQYGEWALPYVTDEERDVYYGPRALAISAGRCAAISYLNQDKVDPEADINRHDRLRESGHMSPMEHQATPRRFRHKEDGWSANFFGWYQYRKLIPNEHDYSLVLAS